MLPRRRFLCVIRPVCLLLAALLLPGFAFGQEIPDYAIVLKPNAQLYRLPLAENPVAGVPLGTTAAVLSVVDVGGVSWSMVALEDGSEGFLPSEYLLPLTDAQARTYHASLANQSDAQPTARPAAQPTATPAATPAPQVLPSLRSLRVDQVLPFSVSFSWSIADLDDQVYWIVYQGDEIFDYELIETATGSAEVWIVPNAAYWVEIYHNDSDTVFDLIEFQTPEADRFRSPSISIQYFRLSYGSAGSDNLSNHTGARTITVADTKNTALDFFVYLTGTYSTSSTFWVDELLVLYRDGDVVTWVDYGEDSFPASWPGFNMTNPFPAEYLETPGAYTATIYFNEKRLATTTFDVIP